MKQKRSISRRNFVKTGIYSSAALSGAASLASCTNKHEVWKKEDPFPVFRGSGFTPSDGVAGLLFSQVGYEAGMPVRIVIRLPAKNDLPEGSVCRLIPSGRVPGYSASCDYWGMAWDSHWWVAEFTGIDESGNWAVEIHSDGEVLWRATGLTIKKDVLWDSTIEWSSVDMLERRVHFTKVGAGWQDAGTLWVESPAQSAMVIALTELLEHASGRFDKSFIDRIHKQITVGCDYLVMTQEKASELGFPDGALSHDLLGHEKDVLPNDALKAVVALEKAVRLLPADFHEKKLRYKAASRKTFDWLNTVARPMGDYGFSRFLRNWPDDYPVPRDEWPTRDLVTWCWAAIEQWKNANEEAKRMATGLAAGIMDRQISEEESEEGYFGHFREFRSAPYSEKSFVQGIVNRQFGADIGGFYPNYLMPLVEMTGLWPDHDDAPKWKECLRRFAFGYLMPSCEKNPFLLVPQGIFRGEGPVWFCGTFHGSNAVYGYTAALALELARLFDEPRLRDIAYGNLQWLAGLNGGITRKNLETGCVVFSTDVPEGTALPASMMCGVGNRWAGTWFQTRGSICNGFSTGRQFIYDTEPKKENDGPFSLTDEDWIPHAAGWVTGLLRL